MLKFLPRPKVRTVLIGSGGTVLSVLGLRELLRKRSKPDVSRAQFTITNGSLYEQYGVNGPQVSEAASREEKAAHLMKHCAQNSAREVTDQDVKRVRNMQGEFLSKDEIEKGRWNHDPN